ncbi:MAG: hypothetical protein KKH60_11085 [Proteobacteria bacterium]|nr:hypothetical protein [Pseudomonadota bacterium]MBU1137524.1 hypothetical protein [Pseudomonadota bacterium]
MKDFGATWHTQKKEAEANLPSAANPTFLVPSCLHFRHQYVQKTTSALAIVLEKTLFVVCPLFRKNKTCLVSRQNRYVVSSPSADFLLTTLSA